MPLVIEHTIYSVVNVLRPAVRTNQNNFAQLLSNWFSCCVCCNLPMLVPSHSITTVICTNHTRMNSTICTTVVVKAFIQPTSRMLTFFVQPVSKTLTLFIQPASRTLTLAHPARVLLVQPIQPESRMLLLVQLVQPESRTLLLVQLVQPASRTLGLLVQPASRTLILVIQDVSGKLLSPILDDFSFHPCYFWINLLCDNTLRASYACIANHPFFDRALPEPSAALAASPAIISIFIWRLGQSLFICPNSPHAKHLILLASHCYYCCYGYGYGYRSPCTPASLSAASIIFPRSIVI